MKPMTLFRRWWFFDYILDRFQWYRRWCGGHWELWYIDVVHDFIWHQMSGCTRTGLSKHYGYRVPCGFGTPRCEQWEAK